MQDKLVEMAVLLKEAKDENTALRDESLHNSSLPTDPTQVEVKFLAHFFGMYILTDIDLVYSMNQLYVKLRRCSEKKLLQLVHYPSGLGKSVQCLSVKVGHTWPIM